MRISSAPIKVGYTVWVDNVRQLMELRTKLNDNKVKMETNKKKLRMPILYRKSCTSWLRRTGFMTNWRQSMESRQTLDM